MIKLEKLEKGEFFEDAFLVSYRYNKDYLQNKAGIWCKPTARMVLTVDGGTSPAQRAAIIKQGFDEVCENIEKLLEEM